MFENYMVSTKLTDALFGRKGRPGVVHRCSIKKLLEKFRKLHWSIWLAEFFFIKLQGYSLQLYRKR